MKAATGRCSVKGVLRCAFANEFELFWIVQSRGTLTKLGALRSSHRRVSVKKGILRNFANFTGKHLCQSLFFNKVAGRPANVRNSLKVSEVFHLNSKIIQLLFSRSCITVNLLKVEFLHSYEKGDHS